MLFNFKKVGGVLLALLTSLAYIINIYVVKLSELSASSVSLVRGVLQILVFTIAILRQRRNIDLKDVNASNILDNTENNGKEISEKSEDSLTWLEKRKPLLLAISYGFLAASLSFSFLLGI